MQHASNNVSHYNGIENLTYVKPLQFLLYGNNNKLLLYTPKSRVACSVYMQCIISFVHYRCQCHVDLPGVQGGWTS